MRMGGPWQSEALLTERTWLALIDDKRRGVNNTTTYEREFCSTPTTDRVKGLYCDEQYKQSSVSNARR